MQAKNHIREIIKGRVVIVGIGNKLRGDDGFGPIMIERLKGKVDAVLIDAGTSPENYLGPITKSRPNTIIILDTAELGKDPGSIDILNKNDILRVGFSTHDASPALFIEYLEAECKADVFMIGLQPASLAFGKGISEEAEKAMDSLCQVLRKKSLSTWHKER